MNVKPIPNVLLGDKIILIVPTAAGFTETPIFNVRVERSENIGSYSSDDPHCRAEITAWVDYHNSTWTEFPGGAKVRFGGEVFEIIEQKVYSAGEPHHCKFTARKIGDERK